MKLIPSVIQSLSYPIIIGFMINNRLYSFDGATDMIIAVVISFFLISLAWFILYESYYRFYQKNKIVEDIYVKLLCGKEFPNPWNYFIDDGVSYFGDIAYNETIDTGVRLQAMKIYSELKLLSNQGKFASYNRLRYASFLAINKYFHNFEDGDSEKPNIEKKYKHKNHNNNLSYVLFCFFTN